MKPQDPIPPSEIADLAAQIGDLRKKVETLELQVKKLFDKTKTPHRKPPPKVIREIWKPRR